METILSIRKWNKLRKASQLIQCCQIRESIIYPLIIKIKTTEAFFAVDIEDRIGLPSIAHIWKPTKCEFIS